MFKVRKKAKSLNKGFLAAVGEHTLQIQINGDRKHFQLKNLTANSFLLTSHSFFAKNLSPKIKFRVQKKRCLTHASKMVFLMKSRKTNFFNRLIFFSQNSSAFKTHLRNFYFTIDLISRIENWSRLVLKFFRAEKPARSYKERALGCFFFISGEIISPRK